MYKLLELIKDNKLCFERHIANLCQTASYKLHALRRIRKNLTLERARALVNILLVSQFNYAYLTWMFWKTIIYFQMQKIHHKTLTVTYQSDEPYKIFA